MLQEFLSEGSWSLLVACLGIKSLFLLILELQKFTSCCCLPLPAPSCPFLFTQGRGSPPVPGWGTSGSIQGKHSFCICFQIRPVSTSQPPPRLLSAEPKWPQPVPAEFTHPKIFLLLMCRIAFHLEGRGETRAESRHSRIPLESSSVCAWVSLWATFFFQ